MERILILIAGLLVGTAVILLWRNNLSAAFVTGTLGVVSWFLSYRTKLRAGMTDEEEREDSLDDIEDSEDSNET
jgi:hypothetical protein